MAWSRYELVWEWAGLDIGCSVFDKCWAGYVLSREGVDVCWSGYGLACAWAGLDM
jgi:hypothetical protein